MVENVHGRKLQVEVKNSCFWQLPVCPCASLSGGIFEHRESLPRSIVGGTVKVCQSMPERVSFFYLAALQYAGASGLKCLCDDVTCVTELMADRERLGWVDNELVDGM